MNGVTTVYPESVQRPTSASPFDWKGRKSSIHTEIAFEFFVRIDTAAKVLEPSCCLGFRERMPFFFVMPKKKERLCFLIDTAKKMNGLVSVALTTGIMLLLTLLANQYWPVPK